MKRAIWSVGGVVGLVAVALIVAALTGATGPGETEAVASSGSASGQSGERSRGGGGSTVPTVAPEVTTTALGHGVQSISRRPPPTDAPTTSTPGTPATTSTTATTATTSDGGPPGPACEPSLFTATAVVDKPAFGHGQPVKATAAFTNKSGRTCYWISTIDSSEVLDQSGLSLTNTPRTVGDPFRWVGVEAGETSTFLATWDQQVCRDRAACEQARPGRYTFVLTRQPFGTARVSFAVNASG